MKRSLLTYALLLLALMAGAQQRAFTVGQYNIRYDEPNDAKKGNGWEQRAQHVRDIIYYEWWDLVGLQEVLDQQLETLKAGLGEYDFIGVAREDGKKAGEYAPILYKKSRMRCLQSGTFWLSETPDKVSYGWDAACRRVCSWGYFKDKLTKKKFWFFNTHMDHKGKVARVEGAKLVISKINQMCGKGAKVILTGDFNVAQDSPAYKTFAESGLLKDSYELAPVKFAPTGTFNSFKVANHTTKRIDHIFVSEVNVLRYGVLTYHYWSTNNGTDAALTDAPKEIKAEHRGVHLPSDHYPVQIFVDLK